MSTTPSQDSPTVEAYRALVNAIEEMDRKLTTYWDEKGEWAVAYVVPAGPWHRLFALARAGLPPSYVEERLDANAPTPEQIADEVKRGGK